MKCVIFDMDGTLTQTNLLIFESFNHIAEEYLKKRLTPPEIISLFGPPEEEAIQKIIGTGNLAIAMEKYYRFYQERHNELASLYPGIREILEILRMKKVAIALFTGKGRRTTDITMQKLGIEQFFDLTVTGDDVDHFKPSGDGIRKILRKCSLQPDEAVMVGDAVADIKAAHECGVPVAAVVWDSYGKESVMKETTDFLFHSVDELRSWLEQRIDHNERSAINDEQ
ncbi:MAG TPA: HAD family hydrolase [Bacteroidota bacterium]|nr:HAD family hydrolase [Bacteroidota bacterium]